MKSQILKIFFDETKTVKKAKIIKRVYAFKIMHTFIMLKIRFAYQVFPWELQIKDTESSLIKAIKFKLKKLLNELRGFKFVVVLILRLKKKQAEMKQNMSKRLKD